ncbi:MAG: class I SAM-dependent methyltransferase [Sedimentisphaerales bacterium]|nr:class I SAM-dependent methyltransferase [Sedimentisphaerales bacterium]
MAKLSPIRRLLKLVHPEGIPWPGAVFYNSISSTAMFQHHYELVAKDILNHCTQGNLLDIGTGPAWLLLKIHQQAPQMRLVGIDSSPAMVIKARQNVETTGIIEIKEGNADHIPFPDGCFDIVVSTASIHHWKEPTAGLNEVYRVLREGGYALVYDLVSDTPESILVECRREFGRLKTTLFWLHSFEEPFYSRNNFEGLARTTLFREGQTRFLGLLCCLILKKGPTNR